MSTLEDIIDSLENLEVKRALAVKMFIVGFKTNDICKMCRTRLSASGKSFMKMKARVLCESTTEVVPGF